MLQPTLAFLLKKINKIRLFLNLESYLHIAHGKIIGRGLFLT